VETRQCSRGGHRVEFGKHIGAGRIAFVYKFDYSLSIGDTRVFVRYNKHEIGVFISLDIAIDGGLIHIATDTDIGRNIQLAEEKVIVLPRRVHHCKVRACQVEVKVKIRITRGRDGSIQTSRIATWIGQIELAELYTLIIKSNL